MPEYWAVKDLNNDWKGIFFKKKLVFQKEFLKSIILQVAFMR